MPTYLRPDDKPVVQFDPLLEISPFTLFRRLQQGNAPRLVDVRAESDNRSRTLQGAVRYEGEDWRPEQTEQVVLFDTDGSAAEPIARRLHAEGYEAVKILFGGIELYEFALDPNVVGDETFLVDAES